MSAQRTRCFRSRLGPFLFAHCVPFLPTRHMSFGTHPQARNDDESSAKDHAAGGRRGSDETTKEEEEEEEEEEGKESAETGASKIPTYGSFTLGSGLSQFPKRYAHI